MFFKYKEYKNIDREKYLKRGRDCETVKVANPDTIKRPAVWPGRCYCAPVADTIGAHNKGAVASGAVVVSVSVNAYRVRIRRPSASSTVGASAIVKRSAIVRSAPRARFSRKMTAEPAGSFQRASPVASPSTAGNVTASP